MNSFRYLPHTDEDIQTMLQSIGVNQMEDLFSHIPKDLRVAPLNPSDASGKKKENSNSFEDLEGPLDESSLRRRFQSYADNSTTTGATPFIGAGYYPHMVPAAVQEILHRSELYTAYTPYQPEVAQGTLQLIYEFQTLICQLTGCDVTNASLYNGASAAAEAALMAIRITRRDEIVIHRSLHPHYAQVLNTTLSRTAKVTSVPFNKETGLTDLESLAETVSNQTAAIIIQNPNFFGCIEDLRGLSALAHDCGALLITVVNEPLSLGLLAAPAKLGADLVAGEGGHLGQPLNYGGPGLGFLATQQKHLRSLPGRLVGETLDQTGKRCFVLTLSTREQHIRRQKATSNICTNQSLCALAFTLMVSLLGKNGFQKLAYLNLAKNQFLTERLGERKIRPYFSSATFNERLYGPFNKPAPGILEELQRRGFIAGLAVGDYFPEIPDLQNTLLICTTEEHPRSQIEAMAEALKKVNR